MRFISSLLSALPFRKSVKRFKLEEATVYSVQRSFYVWAVVVAGLAGALCVHRWPGSAGVWGWVFTCRWRPRIQMAYTIWSLASGPDYVRNR